MSGAPTNPIFRRLLDDAENIQVAFGVPLRGRAALLENFVKTAR